MRATILTPFRIEKAKQPKFLRLCILALLAISLMLLSACAAKKPASRNAISAKVPDKAFRNYLLENDYAARVHGNLLCSTAKGLALTEMYCYEKGISSLQGIEMFPQLETLTCSSNPIVELDLNCLPRLQGLYGIHMPLQRICIDSCHELHSIELSYTALDTFDLTPFPKLRYFFCIFSPLRHLNLQPVTRLRSLYIRGTQIEDIDITPCEIFHEIHATDTPLQTIWCTDAQYASDEIVASLDTNSTCTVKPVPWNKLTQLKHRAVLLNESRALGITLDSMEFYYPSGMLRWQDSIPQQYLLSWQQFVTGLRDNLIGEGLNWTKSYSLWGRAFFNADGKVDFYFYTWRGEHQPSNEWKARFHDTLEHFLSTYRFDYPMHQRFAQCGGILLQPAD